MLFQVIEENGQKKIQPLTADAGAGNPVGTIIPMYKKSSPSGYLYCDGSTFDETAYPLLYAYLGSNVLPDYREFALVGAEQNTTDVYNESTNPDGTIHDHDIYTEGQAKDDQMQVHRHANPCDNVGGGGNDNASVRGSSLISGSVLGYMNDNPSLAGNGRVGTVTHGKRKAVYFYIKATSGLSENAQDNVINTLNEQRSYSTEEHLTGKKWIDGKPIYAKTVFINNMADFPFNTGITNIDEVIATTTMGKDINNSYPMPYYNKVGDTGYYAAVYFNDSTGVLKYDGNMGTQKVKCTIEYTKTN